MPRAGDVAMGCRYDREVKKQATMPKDHLLFPVAAEMPEELWRKTLNEL